MSELVPSTSPAPFERLRKALPWFGGLAALGGAALVWSLVSTAPQRQLYSELSDGERASVVAALDKAAIAYTIDNQTGALSVGEDDLYRARMLVAADGALATPETGATSLDTLPLGASRTLEGERLKSAREHELQLTIMEIDGVEAVRVHLAEAAKSVFVREDTPPTASVMVRMARGRQLGASQVAAVVNLVAGSVPGLSPDAVRVADQHGRLLSNPESTDSDGLELQARMEEKLRGQLDQLLTPMLGAGNFSSEIQVELDMDEVTSARESYDKDGVVRSESQQQSTTTGTPGAIGIPGQLSNTPAPAASASPGPPQGTPSAAPGAAPVNGESPTNRCVEQRAWQAQAPVSGSRAQPDGDEEGQARRYRTDQATGQRRGRRRQFARRSSGGDGPPVRTGRGRGLGVLRDRVVRHGSAQRGGTARGAAGAADRGPPADRRIAPQR
jgi:flagellar M-ring protein FliF